MFVCFTPQQYFINNNNVNTSSIKIFVTMTSFPPSAPTMTMAIGTPQQQQLQPEHDPTMAMAITIMTHRQQHGNREERESATVLYHQQQYQHARYQEHSQHVLPSKCNLNSTVATTTGT